MVDSLRSSPGPRRFPLLRNFVVASVLAIGLVTLALSYLFVQFSKASFTQRVERRSSEEAVHFAELFYKDVWTPSLQETPGGTIQDINLSIVDTFAHDISFGLSIVRVSVFDLNGMLIYTTDPTVTSLSDMADLALSRRVGSEGVTYSVLERNQSLTLPTGKQQTLDVINTITPLGDASFEASLEGNVVGVLTLYQDVTRDLSAAKAQAVRTAIIGSAGTGVALFLFLFLIVLRADGALRRQELELEHAHAQNLEAAKLSAIGLLVSGVAHELNNPLTGVSGLSELLLRRNLADDVKEDVSLIHTEALRSLRIVQDLLVFARPSGVAAREPISLNTAVENVLNPKKSDLATQNIQVEAKLDPRLPLTLANLHAIQQVVLNLVVNAEQAMVEARGRGHLRVTTEQAGSMVRVVVSDDGPGISKENLPKIFDPFFTTKDVGKGTGLGLSICYSIVQEHGGAIRVESIPGYGATFIVELPMTDTDVLNAMQPRGKAAARPIANSLISRTGPVPEKKL